MPAIVSRGGPLGLLACSLVLSALACGGGGGAPCVENRDCIPGGRCEAPAKGAAKVCVACDAEETPYDGLDNDCDPRTLDLDLDGDGDNARTAASRPGTDCDDTDPTTSPAAPELCGDGKDNDCDGRVDEPECADHTPPTLRFVTPVAGMAYAGDLRVELEANDDTRVAELRLLGISGEVLGARPSNRAIFTVDTNLLEEGLVTLQAEAKDIADRITRTSISFTVDNHTAPELVVLSPETGSFHTGSVELTGDAADASGLKQVSISVDGRAATVFTAPPFMVQVDTSSLAEGLHTATFVATDIFDNSVARDLSFGVDRTPPIVTATITATVTARGTIGGAFTVRVDATDAADIGLISSTVGDLAPRTTGASHLEYTLDPIAAGLPSGPLQIRIKVLDGVLRDGRAGEGNERQLSMHVTLALPAADSDAGVPGADGGAFDASGDAGAATRDAGVLYSDAGTPVPSYVASHVSAGEGHTCALLGVGKVKCWGSSAAGELGLGDMSARGDTPGDMGGGLPEVDLGAGALVTQLVVAHQGAHSCAILDGGALKCWGRNDHGELGLGDLHARGDAPGEMGALLPAVALGAGRKPEEIALGRTHSCARLDDGSVKCWGQNEAGELGLEDTSDRGGSPGQMGNALPAVQLGSGRSATHIFAGPSRTCAILDDGGLKCWGANGSGALGLGDSAPRGGVAGSMGDHLLPVDLGAARRAREVAMGANHCCALLDDGTVKCWGENDLGQLGLPDLAGRGAAPGEMGDALPTVDLGAGRSAVHVAAAADRTCVLLDDGEVKCWGDDPLNASLGVQGFAIGDALPEVPLGSGFEPVEISVAGHHACASFDQGLIKCWGAFPQIGLEDQNSRDAVSEMGDALPFVSL